MGLFNKSTSAPAEEKKGIAGSFQADIIKWEPENDDDTIVHKFEAEDFPNGSQLIVPPSMTAVFINYVSSGDSLEATGEGKAQVSIFNGPEKIRLQTGDSRFAPFRKMTNAFTGGETAFHSQVYFVKNIYMTDLPWGAGIPDMTDPETGLIISVGAFGKFGVHIEKQDRALAAIQVRKFLEKVVGTKADYTKEDLLNHMSGKIEEYVPNLIANTMESENIGILRTATKLSFFSNEICKQLAPYFDSFGITLDSFSFNRISAADDDLARLKEAKQSAMETDMESAAIARKRAREGYTYQDERAYDVLGTAAANEGTASPMMGMGMGLGMGAAVGGIFGQGMHNMAGTVVNPNSALFGATPQMAQQPQMPQQAAPAAPETSACPSCGAQVPKNSKFCTSCGNKMVEETLCPGCGKPVAKDAKFCAECGYKLKKVCPNCGTDAGSSKFCPECGTAL